MNEPKSPEIQSVTAWHPMLVALLERYLPAGWQLLPEFLLNRQPQRVDIVVVRKTGIEVGRPRKLLSIFDYLRPHTLIEHKGPTDDLEPGDALTLLGYAMQYMRLAKVSDPSELCLMVVCDRIPNGFVQQMERHGGTLSPIGDGLWRGSVAGLVLHGVETGGASLSSLTERLLYTFSRAFLRHPGAVTSLDQEELRVYHGLYQQVARFRAERGAMAVRDFELIQKSYQEAIEEMLGALPLQVRLRGLTAKERVAGLTSDELEEAIAPELLDELVKKHQH